MTITNSRKLQIGLESTKGTAVPATAIWRGPVTSIQDDREVIHPEEHVGLLILPNRTYTRAYGATYAMPQTEATFEQLPYILSAGVDDLVEGVANGGTTNGYVYAYPFATTTAAAAIKTYTLEAGNSQQAYEVEYALVDEFTLSGNAGEAVMVEATWKGRQRTKCTYTADLTLSTVEEVQFGKGKIYLNASGGTIGQTQLEKTWLGFKLNVKTGWVLVKTGDGSLYPTFEKYIGAKITGSLIVEYDTTGVALEDDFAAGSTHLMRMRFLGAALTGTGGTYTTKALDIDAPVVFDKINTLDSKDGNDTIQVDFTAVYSASDTPTYPSITVCNLLSALP
jgi:hypothetical protein